MKFTEEQIKKAKLLAAVTADTEMDVIRVEEVGSAYIKGEGNDIDIIVLVKPKEEQEKPKKNPPDYSLESGLAEWFDLHETQAEYYAPDIACVHFPGWEYGGSINEGDPGVWESFKKVVDMDGQKVVVNMILVSDKDYYADWMTAAEVCRLLHLKGIEVPTNVVHGIHAIIMDDSTADQEQSRNY